MPRAGSYASATDLLSPEERMDRAELRRAGEALLAWHARTERDLPWRGETDPYRIWVSETMLQQTRAAAAAPRYARFLEAFPDVAALAASDEQEVLALWQGMGYYARARNLRRAAQEVVRRWGGAFPRTEEELRSLPGVGEYTACAVLSMAFGEPVAAVDANLARCIGRAFGLRGVPEEHRAKFRAAGTEWLLACAADRPGDFNRALMGLGALLCTARSPRCGGCPLAPFCRAHAWGEELALPERRPKAQRAEEHLALALLFTGGAALVRQRPPKGMLASLWEFPHVPRLPEEEPEGPLAAALAEEGLKARPLSGPPLGSEFPFTHRLWRIRAARFALLPGQTVPPLWRPVGAEELEALPMPSVMEPYRREALRLLGEAPDCRP